MERGIKPGFNVLKVSYTLISWQSAYWAVEGSSTAMKVLLLHCCCLDYAYQGELSRSYYCRPLFDFFLLNILVAIEKSGFQRFSTILSQARGVTKRLYSEMLLSQMYQAPHDLQVNFFVSSREFTFPVRTTVPQIMISLLRCIALRSRIDSATISFVGGTLISLISRCILTVDVEV